MVLTSSLAKLELVPAKQTPRVTRQKHGKNKVRSKFKLKTPFASGSGYWD
jgi:hypothetical protein